MQQFPLKTSDIPQIAEKPKSSQQGSPRSHQKYNQKDTDWINEVLVKV
jgi:hypothetical protein